MKPQDLSPPFLWKERHPCIQSGVFYVPKYYFEHASFSKAYYEDFFQNYTSIACELCSGNGDWIIAEAQKNPHMLWIAVEQRFDRVRKIWSKMMNHRVTNLRIVCGTAETFFQYYVPNQFLQRLVVNFPDPWPKSRHRKHRLFQPQFVQEIARTLEDSAVLTLVTDAKPYLLESIAALQAFLTSTIKTPHYIKITDNYGNSWFENLWRAKGQDIFYTEFTKKAGI
ncbi:tRNA (guanosine(46)-N7)-methyltransferase TrmB [Chlamydia serpentis]|uniref:tRNA (guanine-N(7)-)-methyltransferase n=1 Tax=Chlamydia serpentis TaxID=1967782 RepID=A0A2R8FCK4_9CHLA|nr:tRNA (guanosine(46)-N(7))-methyltransferase TrmB [Chlamydia serpentis]SPN74091.1 tRNA (guanosine(46)-N7)-methyltransferase TrmB [Chlamydia serpentis]